MNSEVLNLASESGHSFLQNVDGDRWDNVGRYLRVKASIWLAPMDIGFSPTDILNASGLSLEEFRQSFDLGSADARVFILEYN